jgi:hypothetical protein
MTYHTNPQTLRILQQKAITRAEETATTGDWNRTRDCIELAHKYGEAADEAATTSREPIHVPDEDDNIGGYPDPAIVLAYFAVGIGIGFITWVYSILTHSHLLY